MPFIPFKMWNWKVERSGPRLRVRGIRTDENNIPTENFRLTNVGTVEPSVVGSELVVVAKDPQGSVVAYLMLNPLEL